MLLFPISALMFKIGSKCCCKKLRKLAKKKFVGLVWNGIIQFFCSTYLVLCFVSWININNLHIGHNYSKGQNASSILACALAGLTILLPVGLYLRLITGFKRAKDADSRKLVIKHYGESMIPLDYSRKYPDAVCLVPILPLLYQLFLCLASLYLQKHAVKIIFANILLAMYELMFLMQVKPYKSL